MEIRNATTFPAAQTVLFDRDGAETLIVALKATFSVGPGGVLAPVPEQAPLSFVDRFRGDPAKSSIVEECEMGPVKPATDVFFFGEAVPPRAGLTTMPFSFRCGPVRRDAVVHGRRVWAKTLGFSRIEGPAPLERVPLTFENTFGGTDLSPEKPEHRGWEPRNPVGRGFLAKKTRVEWVGTDLPAVEDPADPLKSPGQIATPAGFTPVGRHWEPRKSFAGTYDEAWVRDRIPLLPADFDDRFHSAAPPGLVAPGHLAGDEDVQVSGCRPEGPVSFRLPGAKPRCRVLVAARESDVPLRLDTVVVRSEPLTVTLLYKGSLGVHRLVPRLRRTSFDLPGGKA